MNLICPGNLGSKLYGFALVALNPALKLARAGTLIRKDELLALPH